MAESCLICLDSHGSPNSEKNIIDWRNALNDKRILMKVFELTKTDFVSCSLCSNCYRLVSTIEKLENELVAILNTARTAKGIKPEDKDEDAIEIVPFSTFKKESIAIDVDLDMMLDSKEEPSKENIHVELFKDDFIPSVDELDDNLKIRKFHGNPINYIEEEKVSTEKALIKTYEYSPKKTENSEKPTIFLPSPLAKA